MIFNQKHIKVKKLKGCTNSASKDRVDILICVKYKQNKHLFYHYCLKIYLFLI